jgi:5-methyltetrahydrofolate--homocysteine methyltransferase
VFNPYPLAELVDYIDWTPFFQSWELAGKFPAILQDPIVGTDATKLYRDAQDMLQRIVAEGWLQARAVIGLFPARQVGDDVQVFQDEHHRNTPLVTLHFLRQQREKAPGQPNLCLADFIAPENANGQDYLGAFAVTAGIGIEKWVQHFEENHDDYQAILLKALADRLAEALAERIHERVRKEFWAYTPQESLPNADLIAESYQGIRPAPGYPACPDHTEKATLWSLLDVERHTGIQLTESFAMYPAASVSGWYFSHPQAKYFGLGDISKDQVEDYARRKAMDLADVERWLAPVLNYA